MEHSHKNTDCYFFYYSTCKKGDNCPFRHEPSALGCETMCSYWQQGNCLNEHCNFRHMELKKNRKSIPCYWETQPSGCRKPHCSFLHKNARTITTDPINPVKTSELTSKTLNQEWLNRQDDTKFDGSSTESDQGRGSSEAGSFIGSPAVDPLIVKFEEGTLSLPSNLQTNLNLPNTLGIPNSLTIPNNVPNSLSIPSNISVANNLNVPQPNMQNSQSSPCHHALSYAHQPNLHAHSPGQSLSPLQNQQGSPLLQQPSYSPIHTQQTPQPQTSRFPFPFIGIASYRRF